MAQENIKLTKTIYSTKSTDGVIDRSFSEFFKTKDPINLDRFFSLYNELFYDIPKTGNNSHESIIKQSREYVNNYYDEKDDIIDSLTERIAELEQKLNEPTEEHPFFTNGSLIAPPSQNDDSKPDGYAIYYMDRGKRRYVIGNHNGEVFKALKASLGFDNDADKNTIVKIVPRLILDGITEGSQLGLEDLRGQTNTLAVERQLISDIQVSDWKVELRDLTQPIPTGGESRQSIVSEIEYIELLKNKIKSEFEREGTLESLAWKYTLDATQGFTQQEKDNGETLLKLVRPKLLRSRQTLAILKRIWDVKENYPNINFDDILPSTAAVNSDGEYVSDRGSGTQRNELTEAEVNDAYSGWDEGRDLFEGILSGTTYNIDLINLPYGGSEAQRLIDEGFIEVKYKRDRQSIPGFYFGAGYRTLAVMYPLNENNQYFDTPYRYTFDKFVYI